MSIKLEDQLPGVQANGLNTAKAASFSGAVTFSGSTAGVRSGASVVTGNTTVTAAQSGTVFVDTKGSATTTFTLPDAGTTAGLSYTFVCGDAGGEILVTPASGDKIVCKTQPSETGAGVAPAAGTGIKNTAATNVKGDHITLAFDGVDTWWQVAQAGVWASQ